MDDTLLAVYMAMFRNRSPGTVHRMEFYLGAYSNTFLSVDSTVYTPIYASFTSGKYQRSKEARFLYRL